MASTFPQQKPGTASHKKNVLILIWQITPKTEEEPLFDSGNILIKP